jgi:hypothetical protein
LAARTACRFARTASAASAAVNLTSVGTALGVASPFSVIVFSAWASPFYLLKPWVSIDVPNHGETFVTALPGCSRQRA